MGTLVFAIICLLRGHDAPNDYQVLPLLISLDVIGLALVGICLQMRKSKGDGGPSASD